ncbi:MAG: ABC-F family ATP-binding cassette domain-containing protein [Pseudoclavibacter sp.]
MAASASHPSVTLNAVSFAWPDGSPAMTGLTAAFSPGLTGLIGDNGAGKSTLLRLITGELRPSTGEVAVAGTVAALPQTVATDPDATVADLLGIGPRLRALRAITAGSVDPRDYEALDDDWDIEAAAARALAAAGLPDFGLDRPVTSLSGGEAMLIGVAGVRQARADVTLLDEPTNSLDADARARVRDLLRDWPGTVVVVSHDEELLERVDRIAELHDGEMTVTAGGLSAWRERLQLEQEAALRAARQADEAVARERRQRQDAAARAARSTRMGKADRGSLPRILLGGRAQQAQRTAGAAQRRADDRVEAAQREAAAAAGRVRDDDAIRLDLPDPDVPAGRRIARLGPLGAGSAASSTIVAITGPERVALVGPNGAGKTTLLRRLLAGDPAAGRLFTDRVGYLPQRLETVRDDLSAIDNVREAAPGTPPETVRAQLARLLLRGAAAERPAGTLSGGERFRVALARLLLAVPPAQLLVLDEPTNNLDLSSIDQLVQALSGYRGALLVVSHDRMFRRRIGVARTIEFSEGTLREGSLS